MAKKKKQLILETIFIFTAALIFAFVFQKEEKSLNSIFTKAVNLEKRSSKVTIYKPDKAFNGFTLVPVDGTEEVWLINMKGQIVHKWNVDVERARLLPNGHLLVIHGSKTGRYRKKWAKLRSTLAEYDWNGNMVWKYVADDVIHHDVKLLPNGNLLFLKRTIVPKEYKTRIIDPEKRKLKIRGDSIIEINRKGEVVWRWDAHQHLDLNSCGKRGCRYLLGQADQGDKAKDWTHTNTVSVIPENKWYKAGDKRFKPGNLIILPRNWWQILIIDRATGDVVWTYEGDYKGGLNGGHEAFMIPEGIPGAGNILVLDNGAGDMNREDGGHQGESFVLEINPLTKEIVWKYESKDFFTRTRGSVQRFKNGNTLISEDLTGRAFEVTRAGEIVWEFKNDKPITRAQRYPYDYCPQCMTLPKDVN